MRLMENTGKMKIIFVVSEQNITNSKGFSFKRSLTNFVNMFEDINILKNSVALLVNKATKKLETLRKNFIEKIKDQLTDERMIKVIEFTENSTYIFNEVKDIGEVSFGNLFEDIYQKT